MAGVKLNFRRLSVVEEIAKARQIIAALTGKTNFPSPTPGLPIITTAVNELDTAETDTQAAKRDSKAKTIVRDEKEEVVDKIVSQLVSYVDAVAGDDEQMIVSADMDLRSPGVASRDVPTPSQAVHATAGDHDGEMDLTWDPVSGAKSYIIEQTTDPNVAGSWKQTGVSTKSRITITNLIPSTRYYFRIAAVGTSGQSGWSDPATKIAP